MHKFFSIVLIFLLISCASREPLLVVDPASVKDADQVVIDREECFQIAASIDMSDEAAAKSIGGALLGGGAVAGAAALAFGAVFAPAIPFIIAGGAAGGGLWGSAATKEEKIIKERILKECMEDRGYKVYSG